MSKLLLQASADSEAGEGGVTIEWTHFFDDLESDATDDGEDDRESGDGEEEDEESDDGNE